MNNSFMVTIDLETIYNEKIAEKIAKKLLINLFSKGNNNAYDIYTGKNNGQIVLDDLVQEMLLFLAEHSNEWYLYRTTHRYSTDETRTTLVFLSDETQKDFFRIVSNTLYHEKTRHDNKKLWLEIDSEQGKIDDISFLASHTCIDDVMTLSLYNSFLSYLITAKPKKAKIFTNFIDTRLQGFKIRECAEILSIKESTAFDCAKQLKALWKEFNARSSEHNQSRKEYTLLTDEEKSKLNYSKLPDYMWLI